MPKPIEEELEYFNLNSDQVEVCIKVSNCLIAGPDSPIIMEGFARLNALLSKETLFTSNTMSTLLSLFERPKGININANGELLTTGINRMLTAEEFGQHLSSRTLFKDPGVSANHGDNTHRIQWFILANFGVLSLDEIELLFDALASNLESASAKPPLNGLWDCLFDRLGSSGDGPFKFENKKDFRSPENMNLWLIKEQHDFTQLKLLLGMKHFTRDNQRGQLAMQLIFAIQAADAELFQDFLEVGETKFGSDYATAIFPVCYELTQNALVHKKTVGDDPSAAFGDMSIERIRAALHKCYPGDF